MKEVPVNHGYTALVDDEDYEFVSKYKWNPASLRSKHIYAGATIPIDGEYKTRLMHRLLAEALPGEHVDHIDGNTLNNQRANLRRCSASMNNGNNRKISRGGAVSKYKGVSKWDHGGNCYWVARVKMNGKVIHCEYCYDEEEAAHSYDAAARQHFGEYARVNFPLAGERSIFDP